MTFSLANENTPLARGVGDTRNSSSNDDTAKDEIWGRHKSRPRLSLSGGNHGL